MCDGDLEEQLARVPSWNAGGRTIGMPIVAPMNVVCVPNRRDEKRIMTLRNSTVIECEHEKRKRSLENLRCTFVDVHCSGSGVLYNWTRPGSRVRASMLSGERTMARGTAERLYQVAEGSSRSVLTGPALKRAKQQLYSGVFSIRSTDHPPI